VSSYCTSLWSRSRYSCASNAMHAEKSVDVKSREIGPNSESVAALNLPNGTLFQAFRASRAAHVNAGRPEAAKCVEADSRWPATARLGPVRLPGWCNYDHRPYFARPPTPLKSSVELQNSACRVDTYHPLKTVGIRGFWPRYARLKTTHPPKVGQRQPGSTPT
jgi:hypothetical protein